MMTRSAGEGSGSDDPWLVLQWEQGDGSCMALVRGSLPSAQQQSRSPRLVIFEWRRSTPDGPSEDDVRRSRAFGTLLQSRLEVLEAGFHVCSTTCATKSEWYCYVADAESLLGSLDDDAGAVDPPPVTTEIRNDPEWSFLRRLLNSATLH